MGTKDETRGIPNETMYKTRGIPHRALGKSRLLNFRADEELLNKLKNVTHASHKNLTELITDILNKHLDTYLEDELVDQLKQLPEEKRLDLINRAKMEEAMTKKKKGE